MNQTPIPPEELDLFRFIAPDIKVIFDVGARTDLDYKRIIPEAVCHLFEPNPEFFAILEAKVKEKGYTDIYLNNHGVSDEDGVFYYNTGIQSFRSNDITDQKLPVKTLKWYCEERAVEKIDFLKTDTEGWDLRVILGAVDYWDKIKYIQYEHWNDDIKFRKVLSQDFDVEYIGYRNGLAMNKKLLSHERRQEIIQFIRDNKYGELS